MTDDVGTVASGSARRSNPARRRRPIRTASVALGGLVTVAAVVLSVVGWWASLIIDSPDRTSAAVSVALSDDAVVQDVARAAGDRAVTAIVEVAGLGADDTTNPVVRRLQSTVEDWIADVAAARVVAPVLSSEVTNSLVTSASARAHRVIVETVDGGTADATGGRRSDEPFRVNLLPLIVEVLEAAQAKGFLSRVDVPDLADIEGASAQRQALSEALGITLPREFGEYTIQRDGSTDRVLGVIEPVVSTARRAGAFAPVVALVGFVAVVVESRRRLRTVAVLSGSISLVMGALWAAVGVAVDRFGNTGATAGTVRALRLVAEELLEPLLTAMVWVAAAALVAAVLAAIATSVRGAGRSEPVSERP